MKTILIFLAGIFSFVFAVAQSAGDYRSAANGDWTALSTWEKFDGTSWLAASSAPAVADGAISILTGHTVTISTSFTIDSVFVNTGGILNLNAGTTTTVAVNAGNAGIKVSGVMNVTGKILNQGIVGIGTGGVINFNNTSEYEHAQNGGSLPVSTWNTGSLCNITGVAGTKPSNTNQNYSDFTWNCPGQTGNLDMGWTGNTISGTVRLLNAATFAFRLTNSAANAGSPITITINNIEIQSGLFTSNGSSGVQTYTLNVNGNLSVLGSGVFNISNGSGGDITMYLKGNLTLNSSTASCYTGGLATKVRKTVFSKNGTQVYTKAATNTISTNHQFEVAVDAMVDLNNSIISNGAGSFTVSPFGGIMTSAPGGFNDNFTSSTQVLSFSTQGNYGFTGTAVQTTGTKFSSVTPQCNNFIINNTGAALADTVKLAGPLQVNGTLSLIDGILLPSTTNTLALGPTGVISGGSANSYVAKRISIQTNTTNPVIVPVGKDGNFRPVTLTPETTTASTYDVEYYKIPAPNTTTFTAPLEGVETIEYWDIGRLAGGSAATVKLSLNGAVTGSTAGKKIGVGHFTGGSWIWEGGTALSPGNATSGDVVSAAVNSFSPFTLAILNPTVAPVSLLTFNASYNGINVKLNWNTTNEQSVKKYVVERSNDGRNFNNVGEVMALNNSYSNAYNYTDAGIVTDKVYYRLLTIDLDGTFKYSNIISLNTKLKNKLQVYPNPTANFLTIVTERSDKETGLQIISTDGKKVKELKIAAGTLQTSIYLGGLPAGTYTIISNGTDKQSVSFKKL